MLGNLDRSFWLESRQKYKEELIEVNFTSLLDQRKIILLLLSARVQRFGSTWLTLFYNPGCILYNYIYSKSLFL